MVIIIGFYTTSHGKFHDSAYSDILYGINNTHVMGYCTPEHPITTSHGNYHVLLPILVINWYCES